jgi:molybdate transport system substrate-binding protein
MHIFQRLLILSLAYLIISLPLYAKAGNMTIAAASDLKFALDEAVSQFRKNNPHDEVNVIYGSSGKLYTQIQQGAPYDLYFSADISYPYLLAKAGLASGSVIPYAIGRIVLWAPKGKLDASKMSLDNLRNPAIKRIAIANPKHAPYGKRAEEALKASGLWPQLESKLIYGENVSQTAQFVQTGNAEVGIIALSLALSSELDKNGNYYLIPDNLHGPLEQGFVLTKRAEQNLLAQKFANFMASPEARHIMVKYGFILPHEQP